MADNIQEESLDVPKSNQSENQPDEVIPAKETNAISTNQDTETMEVHHHAHHDGKRNWKSYFWEFLNVIFGSILRISGGVSVRA
ncbi:MAG: hypothetical protein IPN13_12105 [Bacteroidetes bacterium]|nr:hypothetical protein [Bacteroidota bacterium]